MLEEILPPPVSSDHLPSDRSRGHHLSARRPCASKSHDHAAAAVLLSPSFSKAIAQTGNQPVTTGWLVISEFRNRAAPRRKMSNYGSKNWLLMDGGCDFLGCLEPFYVPLGWDRSRQPPRNPRWQPFATAAAARSEAAKVRPTSSTLKVFNFPG